VKLRKIPGALVLGLLASLVAHTALYGGEHAMGGAYSELLLELALAGGLGLAGAAAALAWSAARRTADGSILAADLAARLPSALSTGLSAIGWFIAGEGAEAPHRGPGWLLVTLALAGAAWLVVRLAHALVRAIADAIVAVVRSSFAPRRPRRRLARHPAPVILASPLLRRRFARPPPIATARA
jgi:hypothetical protein